MIRRLLILLMYLTYSDIACCGRHDLHGTRTTSSNVEELRIRYEEYLSLPQPYLDVATGWYTPDSCDGLLLNSLQAVGENQQIEVEAARSSEGIWYRNIHQDGCGENATSRDMFLGLILYSLHFHRLDYLEQVWSYGISHGWKMGPGDSRTILLPWDIGLLARSIHHLGGSYHTAEAIIALPLLDTPGYINHLQIISILIDGITQEGLEQYELDFLHKLSQQMPNNPLPHAAYHKYADGNQDRAASLLLQEWPAGRLPNAREWCDDWIIQREMLSTDLQACHTNLDVAHTGGDLMFVSSLILE